MGHPDYTEGEKAHLKFRTVVRLVEGVQLVLDKAAAEEGAIQGGSAGGGSQRERVLFIGTQFSILYTFMYSPA